MTSSSANLTIIPALSPFVNFIAKSIDTKNNIFAKIGCGLRVDRLINLCAQACFPITNEMMGQFTMIPSDAQLIVLNHVDSLHKWVHVQTLCHDKNVVEESIRPYLSALKISKKSNNIEEAFLGRVFDQLIINSNADEVDTILVEYRKNLPVIKSSAFKTQSLFEKFLNKVTNFVKNPGFKKIIASVGALAALVFFNAYGIQGVVKNLPKLSNFLKKNLPAKICRATSYIYNRVWVIGLTSVFVACVTPQASKINKIATVIRDIAIMLLFWPIILPLKLAILVYNLIHKGVSYTSQSMASGKNVLEARRISKELHHARKLWVDGVKNSRVFLRKPDGTVYNSPQIAQSA